MNPGFILQKDLVSFLVTQKIIIYERNLNDITNDTLIKCLNIFFFNYSRFFFYWKHLHTEKKILIHPVIFAEIHTLIKIFSWEIYLILNVQVLMIICFICEKVQRSLSGTSSILGIIQNIRKNKHTVNNKQAWRK